MMVTDDVQGFFSPEPFFRAARLTSRTHRHKHRKPSIDGRTYGTDRRTDGRSVGRTDGRTAHRTTYGEWGYGAVRLLGARREEGRRGELRQAAVSSKDTATSGDVATPPRGIS